MTPLARIKLKRRRQNAVDVGMTIEHAGFEMDCLFHCDVTPGEPDSYDRSIGGPGGWSPGCGPEVEILSCEDEDGRDRPDILDALSRDDVERIEELAVEQAEEDDIGRYEDAQEAKADAARERWED